MGSSAVTYTWTGSTSLSLGWGSDMTGFDGRLFEGKRKGRGVLLGLVGWFVCASSAESSSTDTYEESTKRRATLMSEKGNGLGSGHDSAREGVVGS